MLINDLKEFKKIDSCYICGNNSFDNLGRITNKKNRLQSIITFFYDESYTIPEELDNTFDLIYFCYNF